MEPLHKLLLDLGLLPGSVVEALAHRVPPPSISELAQEGLLDETQTLRAIARRLHILATTLQEPEVLGRLHGGDLTAPLSVELLLTHRMVPLFESNKRIVVACANPLDIGGLKAIEFALSRATEPWIAPERGILKLLAGFFPVAPVDLKALVEKAPNPQNQPTTEAPAETSGETIFAERVEHDAAPVVRLCSQILNDAIAAHASDIHLEPHQNGLKVRIRVDGALLNLNEIPSPMHTSVLARLKLMAAMDIAERRRPQDGRMRARFQGAPVDLRVSTVPTAYGEKMVVRVLRSESESLSLDALGCSPDLRKRLTRLLDRDGKLILVTGPTGSGKTTTLYGCLRYRMDGESNIQTVEDPVEYRIPGINQIQVNDAIGVSFASALRSILRQDPDVIMVGEIRDAATAEIAIQAAQTGHLVLSTLHTNDAPGAVTRLLNLGVPPYTVAGGLGGVLAQRLVRGICPDCKREMRPEERQSDPQLADHPELDHAILYVGNGCEKCRGTGYRGRIPVISLLEITPPIAELIEHAAPASAIMAEARKDGFISLDEAAIALVQAGRTTFQEVKSHLSITPQPRAERAHSAEPPAARAQQRPTIVLIDDDENIRSVLATLLEREAYEVLQAANGAEGLQLIYASKPTIILCDIMMPVMDGRELLATLQSRPDLKNTPVIMLTAVDNEANETGLLDLGARDFISKSASTKILLSRIRRVMHQETR